MKLTSEQKFAKLPIGVITEGRVICFKCYWDDDTIPEVAEWAVREGYPDGFTCDDCDRVVPYYPPGMRP